MITNLADFYRSKEWEMFIRVLAAERTNADELIICEHCGEPIILKYDRIAHHKTHLTLGNVNNAEISLNPENIAFVHHRCHNEIHERFGFGNPNAKQYKKVYVVHGSPCSGKSSFVASVAGPGDLVLDMDSIWDCISAHRDTTNGLHSGHDERLLQNVFGVRDCLLDQIKTRFGNWQNAYIIGSYPRIMERERLARIYGAEMIHIDTPQAICEARAAERPREWLQYISDYFYNYQT